MKGPQVKTNATVTVPPPNIKCSILLTVATTLTVLIRCLKQCCQQQPYVVLQQMYWVSEARNIQSRHRLKIFQKSTMSNTFLVTQERIPNEDKGHPVAPVYEEKI